LGESAIMYAILDFVADNYSPIIDIVKKLGSWAAILAVPTAVAGIYGMNFKYMPELEWSLGYPAVLLLMLAICGTLYYGFRKVAWL
jgi:magnesium transporter